MFYVIKQGRVRFEDQRLLDESYAEGHAGRDTSIIKVEGEWFGYEAFICGPYANMDQRELLLLSIQGNSAIGNGFKATAMERVELVCAPLETLFSHLSMGDIELLHKRFLDGLYARHPAYDLLNTKPEPTCNFYERGEPY